MSRGRTIAAFGRKARILDVEIQRNLHFDAEPAANLRYCVPGGVSLQRLGGPGDPAVSRLSGGCLVTESQIQDRS